MRNSEAVVVPPIPFGEGNLPIFEEVETVLKEGKPVYIIDLAGVKNRDHSGKALPMLQRLIEEGAVALESIDDLPVLIHPDGGEKGDR